MTAKPSPDPTRFQRYAIGAIAVVMLLMAIVTYFSVGMNQDNAFSVAVCSRVGMVLLTVFLAWPAFRKPIEKVPAFVLLILVGLLAAAAVRPRLLVVGLILAVVGLVVHFGFRFASRKFKE